MSYDIDYKTLLKKYVQYIAFCEGIDYIYPVDDFHGAEYNGIIFSDDERQFLNDISEGKEFPII